MAYLFKDCLWEVSYMFEFALDKYQQERFTRWMSEISALPVKRQGGVIDGRITFSFTPTQIGIVTKATDNMTNKEIDLTDYANL